MLAHTGADALMIGRAAQGRPWIFREIAHFLATGAHLAPPTVAEARAVILEHLADHYAFYGEVAGVRTARKHLGWYTRRLAGGACSGTRCAPPKACRRRSTCVTTYFDRLADAVASGCVYDGGRTSGAGRSRLAIMRVAQRAGEALAA